MFREANFRRKFVAVVVKICRAYFDVTSLSLKPEVTNNRVIPRSVSRTALT